MKRIKKRLISCTIYIGVILYLPIMGIMGVGAVSIAFVRR